ncbi:DUF1206 domain-containing protein [Lacisediminihabitans sp.]|uniref:DUF1206 domain-containing protein n=1 Tax=Lacisediminihabitans sp. TaxID=2787631 RepID=UPI00374D6869
MANRVATSAARGAKNNRVFQVLARLGYAVNGLLHILIGAIAISVATGAGGGEADQSGALGQLAATPGGRILLWVVVVGLAALGVWQLVVGLLARGSDTKSRWAHRAAEWGKGVAYLAIAATALTFANGGSTNAAQSTSGFASGLLATPGGVVILVVLGLGIAGIGLYFVLKGARKKFTDDITVPPTVGRVVVVLGVVGYIAKGIALVVTGAVFVTAAVTIDPSKATGLDGALKALVALPYGPVILWVVGAGLIAYGLYCFARARLARL